MFTPFRLNFATALALGFGFLSGPVQAQVIGDHPLRTLQGFEPSVLSSEDEALNVYRQLPTQIFKNKSQCHQRAHYWAYQLANSRGLKSMKVYLFFTDRYKREFDYSWGYHVAPLIPVKLADGTVQDQVFDPSFTQMPEGQDPAVAEHFDSKPISIKEWINYFIFPDAECPVVDHYQDYFRFQDRYYCYIMKTPMYNYIPDTLATELEVRKDWREGDLLEMQNGLLKR